MFIVADFETSGRSPWHHDIISAGLCVLNDDLEIIDKFYDVCCPWNVRAFDHETTAIHGFTLEELKRCQSSLSMNYKIMNFLNPYRNKERIEYVPFVQHSQNNFDYKFFHNFFLKNELQFSFYKMFHRDLALSTITIGRELMFERNNLKIWCERIGHEFNHHNALSDAIACAKIFRHQMIDLKYKEKINESKALETNY